MAHMYHSISHILQVAVLSGVDVPHPDCLAEQDDPHLAHQASSIYRESTLCFLLKEMK